MAKIAPPPLTEKEKSRWYSKFFYERYEPYGPAIEEMGPDNAPMGVENAVSVDQRFTITDPTPRKRERGWQAMPDRTTFVAGCIFMKDVTPEMFQWWFSWMTIDPIRGRLWDPEEHLNSAIDRESLKRLCNPNLSVKERIYGNIFYAKEDNGTGYESDRYTYKKLTWVNPLDFGYTQEQLDDLEKRGGTLVTMMSGPKDGDYVSSFEHCALPVEGGCIVRSWFFVGHKLSSAHGGPVRNMDPNIPDAALEQIGRGLSMHCVHEYSTLGHILPELWEKCHDTIDDYETVIKEFDPEIFD